MVDLIYLQQFGFSIGMCEMNNPFLSWTFFSSHPKRQHKLFPMYPETTTTSSDFFCLADLNKSKLHIE